MRDRRPYFYACMVCIYKSKKGEIKMNNIKKIIQNSIMHLSEITVKKEQIKKIQSANSASDNEDDDMIVYELGTNDINENFNSMISGYPPNEKEYLNQQRKEADRFIRTMIHEKSTNELINMYQCAIDFIWQNYCKMQKEAIHKFYVDRQKLQQEKNEKEIELEKSEEKKEYDIDIEI